MNNCTYHVKLVTSFLKTNLERKLQYVFSDDGTLSLINQSMMIIQRRTCILFRETVFVPVEKNLTRELVVVFSSFDGDRYVT